MKKNRQRKKIAVCGATLPVESQLAKVITLSTPRTDTNPVKVIQLLVVGLKFDVVQVMPRRDNMIQSHVSSNRSLISSLLPTDKNHLGPGVS